MRSIRSHEAESMMMLVRMELAGDDGSETYNAVCFVIDTASHLYLLSTCPFSYGRGRSVLAG